MVKKKEFISNNNIPKTIKDTILLLNLTQLIKLRTIINEKINECNKKYTISDNKSDPYFVMGQSRIV